MPFDDQKLKLEPIKTLPEIEDEDKKKEEELEVLVRDKLPKGKAKAVNIWSDTQEGWAAPKPEPQAEGPELIDIDRESLPEEVEIKRSDLPVQREGFFSPVTETATGLARGTVTTLGDLTVGTARVVETAGAELGVRGFMATSERMGGGPVSLKRAKREVQALEEKIQKPSKVPRWFNLVFPQGLPEPQQITYESEMAKQEALEQHWEAVEQLPIAKEIVKRERAEWKGKYEALRNDNPQVFFNDDLAHLHDAWTKKGSEWFPESLDVQDFDVVQDWREVFTTGRGLRWVGSKTGEVAPSFLATILPSAVAPKLGIISRSTGMTLGAIAGAHLEAVSVFDEIKKRGGTDAEALEMYVLALGGSAALERMGLEFLLKKAPPGVKTSFLRKLMSRQVASVGEALTESAEEMYQAGLLGYESMQGLRNAANVFLPSLILSEFGITGDIADHYREKSKAEPEPIKNPSKQALDPTLADSDPFGDPKRNLNSTAKALGLETEEDMPARVAAIVVQDIAGLQEMEKSPKATQEEKDRAVQGIESLLRYGLEAEEWQQRAGGARPQAEAQPETQPDSPDETGEVPKPVGESDLDKAIQQLEKPEGETAPEPEQRKLPNLGAIRQEAIRRLGQAELPIDDVTKNGYQNVVRQAEKPEDLLHVLDSFNLLPGAEEAGLNFSDLANALRQAGVKFPTFLTESVESETDDGTGIKTDITIKEIDVQPVTSGDLTGEQEPTSASEAQTPPLEGEKTPETAPGAAITPQEGGAPAEGEIAPQEAAQTPRAEAPQEGGAPTEPEAPPEVEAESATPEDLTGEQEPKKEGLLGAFIWVAPEGYQSKGDIPRESIFFEDADTIIGTYEEQGMSYEEALNEYRMDVGAARQRVVERLEEGDLIFTSAIRQDSARQQTKYTKVHEVFKNKDGSLGLRDVTNAYSPEVRGKHTPGKEKSLDVATGDGFSDIDGGRVYRPKQKSAGKVVPETAPEAATAPQEGVAPAEGEIAPQEAAQAPEAAPQEAVTGPRGLLYDEDERRYAELEPGSTFQQAHSTEESRKAASEWGAALPEGAVLEMSVTKEQYVVGTRHNGERVLYQLGEDGEKTGGIFGVTETSGRSILERSRLVSSPTQAAAAPGAAITPQEGEAPAEGEIAPQEAAQEPEAAPVQGLDPERVDETLRSAFHDALLSPEVTNSILEQLFGLDPNPRQGYLYEEERMDVLKHALDPANREETLTKLTDIIEQQNFIENDIDPDADYSEKARREHREIMEDQAKTALRIIERRMAQMMEEGANQKSSDIIRRVESAVNSRARDNVLLEIGQGAVPGIRLQDAREAGQMKYLLENGTVTQQEFDDWVENARREGRIQAPQPPKPQKQSKVVDVDVKEEYVPPQPVVREMLEQWEWGEEEPQEFASHREPYGEGGKRTAAFVSQLDYYLLHNAEEEIAEKLERELGLSRESQDALRDEVIAAVHKEMAKASQKDGTVVEVPPIAARSPLLEEGRIQAPQPPKPQKQSKVVDVDIRHEYVPPQPVVREMLEQWQGPEDLKSAYVPSWDGRGVQFASDLDKAIYLGQTSLVKNATGLTPEIQQQLQQEIGKAIKRAVAETPITEMVEVPPTAARSPLLEKDGKTLPKPERREEAESKPEGTPAWDINKPKPEIQENDTIKQEEQSDAGETEKEEDIRGPEFVGPESGGSLEETPSENVQGPEGGRGTVRGPGWSGEGGRADALPTRGEGSPRDSGQRDSDVGIHPPARLDTPATNNYVISDEDQVGEGGLGVKYRQNVAAIRTLKAIETENRQATEEERRILVKYVGWGGMPQAFDKDNKKWAREYQELKELLTPEEYEAARASTTNAHYTSPDVIRGIWAGLKSLGFKGGQINEPAFGLGHFFGLMPGDIAARSRLSAVELDPLTARMAKQLYPQVDIQNRGFQDVLIPDDSMDLFISNVPFANVDIVDENDAGLRKLNASLHDYYFSKALRKTRPGGLVVFITSRYSMDKMSRRMRRDWMEYGNFLGAVRLPRTAFKGNANTEVVTDIMVFQRREKGQSYSGEPFLESNEFVVETSKPLINEYYHKHPENVLGRFTMAGSMYAAEELTVEDIGLSISAQVAQAIAGFPVNRGAIDNVFAKTQSMYNSESDAEAAVSRQDTENRRDFSLVVEDGKIYQVIQGRLVPVKIRAIQTEKLVARVAAMIDILKASTELRRLQTSFDATDEQIEAQRKALNDVYDAFLNKYSTKKKFSKQRTPGYLSTTYNKSLFRLDPVGLSYLLALEHYDRVKNTAKKAAIFTERTQFPRTVITSANSPNEALAASLCERGCVDLDYIGNLLDVSRENALIALGDLVYEEPVRILGGQIETRVVTASEYLSGSVRKKLKTAEVAAAKDSRFQRNVDALKNTQPSDIAPHDIGLKIGASWVPVSVYVEFLRHLTGENIGVRYLPAEGTWVFDDVRRRWELSDKDKVEWGTDHIPAVELLNKLANQREIVIKKTEKLSDGTSVTYVDEEATSEAKQKAAELQREWNNWVWADESRTSELVRIYNEMFNDFIPPSFDGSHLTLPGLAEWARTTVRDYQRNAVWRILSSGNTLLAHAVGAGKTWTIAIAVMEMRRLGLANKPVIVVPNHLIDQWPAEFLQLYPSARILAAQSEDFSPKKRQTLMNRIATGNWDAIIVPRTSFEKLPMHQDKVREFYREQMSELDRVLATLDKKDRKTIKQLEAAKARLQSQLTKMTAKWKKDQGPWFDELGIDALFVDEAHEYKNLWFVTKLNRIAGIQPGQAQRAFDMFMKTQYLTERNNGRGVVFATGTPISNTLCEMYTMMRYMIREQMAGANIGAFDSWASGFGETVTSAEVTPEGGGFRMHTRFNRFVNVPELMLMYKRFADIQTAKMLNLPVPELEGGGIETVEAEENEHVQRIIRTVLMPRANRIRRGKVKPWEDNMLAVTTDGRKLALDIRLYDPKLPDLPNSKLNLGVKNIFSIWKATQNKRLTQLVWLDMGTPATKKKKAKQADTDTSIDLKNTEEEQDIDDEEEDIDTAERETIEDLLRGNINLYEDIKKKLVAMGVPENEIAFIHDAKTKSQRETLFNNFRAGNVRILIASTGKLSTGANIQERLYVAHELDAPWRPADVEQRSGRILRQGNTNPSVRLLRYVTKGSFDAYMWQTLENKARFLEQILAGDEKSREVEDIGSQSLSYAEMKALAAGNPKILDFVRLQAEVGDLEVERQGYLNNRYRTRAAIKAAFSRAKSLDNLAEEYAHDAAIAGDTSNLHAKILGKEIASPKELTEALEAIAKDNPTGLSNTKVGTVNGLPIAVEIANEGEGHLRMVAHIGVKARQRVDLENSFFTDEKAAPGVRILNFIRSLSKTAERYRKEADAERASAENLGSVLKNMPEVYAREEELNQKRAQLIALQTELSVQEKQEEENDQDGDAPPSGPDFSNPETGMFLNPAAVLMDLWQSRKRKRADKKQAYQGILEELSDGRRLYDEVPRNDIWMLSKLLSPEFALRNHPQWQKFAGRIIEAELFHTQKGNEFQAFYNDAKGKLTEEQQKKVRQAMKVLDRGNVDEVKMWAQRDPEVLAAAQKVRRYFDAMRERIKAYKRAMFRLHVPHHLYTAFDQILHGADPIEVIQKMRARCKSEDRAMFKTAELVDLLRAYREIDNWGLEDYITNIELGSIKLVDQNGICRAVAVTKADAIRKARELLEGNSDEADEGYISELQIERSYDQTNDLGLLVTSRQANAIRGRVAAALEQEGLEIEQGIAQQIAALALKGKVRVKPTNVFAGAMQKRKYVLRGEENIFDVLPAYSYSVEKKMALDPILTRLRRVLHKAPPNVRALLEAQAQSAKGVYSLGDRILDEILVSGKDALYRATGGRAGLAFSWLDPHQDKGRHFSRLAGRITKAQSALKLGYRPAAALVNKIGGETHTWVKVGLKYMKRATHFLNTDEGRAFLEREHRLGTLGIDFALDLATNKDLNAVPKWHPMWIFSLPEKRVRERCIAANYLWARDNGYSNPAALEYARRALRFQQFTYNTAALPVYLRTPGGRIIGQFKTYLAKEIEFVAGLSNIERVRYIGALLAMSGSRGAVYFLKSLPIFGLLFGAWLDDLEKWALQQHPLVAAGLPGLAGIDIVAASIPQLPHKIEDFAGVTVADIWKTFKSITEVVSEGGSLDWSNPAAVMSNYSPIAYYWESLMGAILSEDGYVRDRHGNKVYQLATWHDKLMLAAGIQPIEMSTQRKIMALQNKEEERRRNQLHRATVTAVNKLRNGEVLPEDLITELEMLSGGRIEEVIEAAFARSEMAPEERQIRKTPTWRRGQVSEELGM